MSYCVNCGVELDKTCRTCPLCHTPVLNPNQPIDTEGIPPFPVKKGTTEPVKRYEVTILISIILFTTAVVCFLTNTFVFTQNNWSIYVMGLCAVLWIFLMPFFFPEKLPGYAHIVLNGLSICLYLKLISWLHPGKGWYQDIGLPITSLATILVIAFYIFSLKRGRSFITKTGCILAFLAILCVSVEIMIHLHNQQPPFLSWSAVVLACCVSIDIILISIYYLKGLREEVRRRMHF